MSTPEIMPEQPKQPDVLMRPEQPIVPETVQSLGVTAAPPDPKPVLSNNGGVTVVQAPTHAASDTTAPSLAIPTSIAKDEKELEKGAHGPANLGVTWLDMYWLREVGKALNRGWRVIFGQK